MICSESSVTEGCAPGPPSVIDKSQQNRSRTGAELTRVLTILLVSCMATAPATAAVTATAAAAAAAPSHWLSGRPLSVSPF